MKPSVLFVASTGSHIRNFHLPYLRAFQEKGWSVHVACGTPAGSIPFADQILELPFEKRMSARSNFSATRRIRQAVREENYTLITVHTSLAAFFTRLALLGLKNRPRVVNMVHGYLYDDETPVLKRIILRSAELLTAPVTDLVLTMNQWDYKEAKRHRLGRQVASVPGVGVDFSRLNRTESADVRPLQDLSSDAFVLIYAAEFSKRKNQAFLIRAMKHLPEHFYLVLAGQGALLEDCKALATQLGVAHRVLFPGYINVAEWYAVSDVVVSASRSEGLPFNIMEAMYLGLPIVASAVKGHTDLIQARVSGLLYPYGDEKAFVRQILYLHGDSSLRTHLAICEKICAPQYGLDKVMPQVMTEYERVLS